MPQSRGPDKACRTSRLDLRTLSEELPKLTPSRLADTLNEAVSIRKAPQGNVVGFLASYGFGESIWESTQRQFVSPCTASRHELCDNCRALEAATSQGAIPLTAVVGGTVEVSTNPAGNRHAPLRILSPGEFFGVFEALNEYHDKNKKYPRPRSVLQTPWQIVAGTRAVQILAPFRDQALQKAIDSTLIDAQIEIRRDPLQLEDPTKHWQAIQKLGSFLSRTQNDFRRPESRILIFNPGFVQTLLSSSKDFALNLFHVGWDQTAYMRTALVEEPFYASKFYARRDAHLRISSFIFSSLRHLMAIQAGRVPGMVPFRPATSDDDAFVQILKLIYSHLSSSTRHQHFPYIVWPRHIGTSDTFAYYSLHRHHCPLPVPVLWDFPGKESREPKIWRSLATDLVEAAETFQFRKYVAAIAGSKIRTSWELIAKDFAASLSKDLQSAGAGRVYDGAEFWSACIRVGTPH